MRLAPLGVVLCFLAPSSTTAKPAASGGADDDVPRQLNVSEVSKGGHIVHNRITFDCVNADESNTAATKEIECVMVQQNIMEPDKPPKREDQDKAIAEMGDLTKACRQDLGRPTKDEPRLLTEFREKLTTACKRNDRAAIADVLRAQADAESQTCVLTTVVFRHTFTRLNPGTWVSYPSKYGVCRNIKVTRTLRRDAHFPSWWNYTEVEVVEPTTDHVCKGTAGTTEFTWNKSVTPYDLKCRYLTM